MIFQNDMDINEIDNEVNEIKKLTEKLKEMI